MYFPFLNKKSLEKKHLTTFNNIIIVEKGNEKTNYYILQIQYNLHFFLLYLNLHPQQCSTYCPLSWLWSYHQTLY